ncbi:hypothetical protein KCU65_g82, partial [Aureobasidium melanogenum]
MAAEEAPDCGRLGLKQRSLRPMSSKVLLLTFLFPLKVTKGSIAPFPPIAASTATLCLNVCSSIFSIFNKGLSRVRTAPRTCTDDAKWLRRHSVDVPRLIRINVRVDDVMNQNAMPRSPVAVHINDWLRSTLSRTGRMFSQAFSPLRKARSSMTVKSSACLKELDGRSLRKIDHRMAGLPDISTKPCACRAHGPNVRQTSALSAAQASRNHELEKVT